MRYCKVQPEASQVNGPQALRGDYCICSCSLSSINDKKWFPVLGFIGSFTSFHPRLCFIGFKMKFNYPVPSHFQFSGRDGSGTWKKVRDGSGTGIPSDPACQVDQHRKHCKFYKVFQWIMICKHHNAPSWDRVSGKKLPQLRNLSRTPSKKSCSLTIMHG